MSYDVQDVVGKTLRTRRRVATYRGSEAKDSGTPFGHIPAGMSIGVVRSWLAPQVGAAHLYWEFDHSEYGTFYVRHQQGAFDIQDLREQGLLTIQEIKDQEEEANLTPLERGERLVRYGISALVLGGIVKAFISSNK